MAVEAEGVARFDQYSGGVAGNDSRWRVGLLLGPSRIAEVLLTAAGAASLAVVLASAVPPAMQAVLVVFVAVSSVRALRRHGRQEGAGGVRRITVDLRGRIEVESADGAVCAGRIAAGSFVAPWLTIVHWVPEGRRFARTVLVLPDAVDAEAFRRLRVLLRCGIIRP